MQQMTMAEKGTPAPRWEEPGVINAQKEQQSAQTHVTALGADFGAPQSAPLSPMTNGTVATAGPAQMRKMPKSGPLKEPKSQQGQGGGAAPVKTILSGSEPEYRDYESQIENITGFDVTGGNVKLIRDAWHEIDYISKGRGSELLMSPSAHLPPEEAYADIFRRYGLGDPVKRTYE